MSRLANGRGDIPIPAAARSYDASACLPARNGCRAVEFRRLSFGVKFVAKRLTTNSKKPHGPGAIEDLLGRQFVARLEAEFRFAGFDVER